MVISVVRVVLSKSESARGESKNCRRPPVDRRRRRRAPIRSAPLSFSPARSPAPTNPIVPHLTYYVDSLPPHVKTASQEGCTLPAARAPHQCGLRHHSCCDAPGPPSCSNNRSHYGEDVSQPKRRPRRPPQAAPPPTPSRRRRPSHPAPSSPLSPSHAWARTARLSRCYHPPTLSCSSTKAYQAK